MTQNPPQLFEDLSKLSWDLGGGMGGGIGGGKGGGRVFQIRH